MTRWGALIAALCLMAAGPARAGLTAQVLAGVGALAPAGAHVPLGLGFVTDQGRPMSLGQATDGRPTVLVIADYNCNYLCGPGITLTASALDKTRLRAGRDYRLVVVGMNPRSGLPLARAFRAKRLTDPAGRAAVLLTGGRPDLVAKAVGFRYVYDPAIGQYAHDTSIYALSGDGVVRAVLPEFALSGPRLATALSDARKGWTGQLAEQVRIICYCLQPLTGRWDGQSMAALRVGGVAILAAMAGALILFARRREQRR